jgi:hypothetical protein
MQPTAQMSTPKKSWLRNWDEINKEIKFARKNNRKFYDFNTNTGRCLGTEVSKA